jgi:hypothetical protein
MSLEYKPLPRQTDASHDELKKIIDSAEKLDRILAITGAFQASMQKHDVSIPICLFGSILVGKSPLTDIDYFFDVDSFNSATDKNRSLADINLLLINSIVQILNDNNLHRDISSVDFQLFFDTSLINIGKIDLHRYGYYLRITKDSIEIITRQSNPRQ